MNDSKQKMRSGIIAVVGRANVGKSTLINQLLEEKISIVSPVPQTTRNLVRGILTEPRGQLVFLDTPGVHKAGNDLGKIMNKLARASVEGSDVILLVFDASKPPRLEDEGWVRRLLFEPMHMVAVLNKADKGVEHAEAYKSLWSRLEEEKEQQKQISWIETSALERQGVDDLLTILFDLVPEGPYLFPEDVLTDYPRKLAISDFVREKFFEVLRDELPHSVAVEVDRLDESDCEWVAEINVFVDRPSQKGIVIGHKGRLLRRVRRTAEKELAAIYDRKIRLHMHVKVEKDWTKNHWMLKRLGYVE